MLIILTLKMTTKRKSRLLKRIRRPKVKRLRKRQRNLRKQKRSLIRKNRKIN